MNWKSRFLLTAKGMAMGAADVVPGVSGGTIAFITGIYETFINALKSFNLTALKILQKKGLLALWKHVNGEFLLFLLAGVFISILSLAKGISWILEHHPVLIWSFFFGLIIASAISVGKKVTIWNAGSFISLIIGGVIAFYITIAAPVNTPESLWFVFITGMVAITAMILPGISGSFILLLMGKYRFILDSLTELNIGVIITFGVGCVTGLLSFSHVLSWMFRKYHDLTIAMLTGFMIGSLNKVWPWKVTLSFRTNSHGESVPFIQESVLPINFPESPQLMGAILLMILGFAVVMGLDYAGNRKGRV